MPDREKAILFCSHSDYHFYSYRIVFHLLNLELVRRVGKLMPLIDDDLAPDFGFSIIFRSIFVFFTVIHKLFIFLFVQKIQFSNSQVS